MHTFTDKSAKMDYSSGLSYQEDNDCYAEIDRIVKKPLRNHSYEEAWRNLPEIPAKHEILPPNIDDATLPDPESEKWNDYQKEFAYRGPDLPTNNLDGPWPSTADFLRFQYEINREDAIAPLRNSVQRFRAHSSMGDDSDTYVYTSVSSVSPSYAAAIDVLGICRCILEAFTSHQLM